MQCGSVETGLQLFSRLTNRSKLLCLDKLKLINKLNEGDTIEISGETSSDNVFLVLHILMNCILPSRSPDQVLIGGQNTKAIFVNTEHNINKTIIVERIKSIIIKSYELVNKIPTLKYIEEITKSAVDNLTIINCYDRLQFRLSILSLENELLHDEKIAMVIIDGITSFYWEDRDIENIWLKDVYLRHIIKYIQKSTIMPHKICLAYTISNDFNPNDTNLTSFTNNDLISHKIHLYKANPTCVYGVIRSKDDPDKIIQHEITDPIRDWIL